MVRTSSKLVQTTPMAMIISADKVAVTTALVEISVCGDTVAGPWTSAEVKIQV